MAVVDYTPGEVVWLLSLDYEDALAADAGAGTSWPDLMSRNFHGGSTGTSDDDQPLLTVLRWWDVQHALTRAWGSVDEEVLELRLDGLSEDQVATVVGRSQQWVSRAWLSTIDGILRELGSGAAVP